jgi:hypothetical protein
MYVHTYIASVGVCKKLISLRVLILRQDKLELFSSAALSLEDFSTADLYVYKKELNIQ